jgi:SAM-dependent methyltransferase
MPADTQNGRRRKVQDYWSRLPCGAEFSQKQSGSREFYDEVEDFRYSTEPEVFSFAQFTRFRGARVLEVGVGLGTDFLQWVRAGAKAYGVDLTIEGIKHARRRLELCGLRAQGLMVADAELLPFPEGAFDLVYCWGVIHHAVDPRKAFQEIIRVCRPAGACKVMVYHRHSLSALYVWVREALLKGRPWKTLAWCIAHGVESAGTRAFTRSEIRSLLTGLGVRNLQIRSIVTFWDRLGASKGRLRILGRVLAGIMEGLPVGWFLTVQFHKPGESW